MRLAIRSAFIVAVALLAHFSAADDSKQVELRGKAARIVDGDTLIFRTETELMTVRLDAIDAPESGQAFGTKSREALKALVESKDVTVKKTGTDKYNRTLGRVIVDGKDINERMIADGWAWHFKRFNQEENLATLENEARAAKRGLWADANALPPWEYRDRQKTPAVADPGPAKPEVKPKADQPKEIAKTKYWLNTSSNVRHNASCEYFANTKKGRYCGSNDGKACGKCGG